MAKKQKYYVVWVGRQPGVYDNWQECEQQVKKFPGAKFKAFETRAEAEQAFNHPPEKYISSKKKADAVERPVISYNEIPDIEKDAIAVDASSQGNPGIMEYRGVYLRTGEEIFRVGKFYDATNNIGEFLAIVHALAYMKNKGLEWPVYSDSLTAIKWVKQKKCKTTLKQTERNKKVFELIYRAEKWLQENTYNNPIIKWDTKKWGEIPADFGRK